MNQWWSRLNVQQLLFFRMILIGLWLLAASPIIVLRFWLAYSFPHAPVFDFICVALCSFITLPASGLGGEPDIT